MPDPVTEELHVDQVRKEVREHRRAVESQIPEESRTHERRAERAAYLREKLGERAAAEERVEREEG